MRLGCFGISDGFPFRWSQSPGRRGHITRGVPVVFFLPRFELDHCGFGVFRGTSGGALATVSRSKRKREKKKLTPLGAFLVHDSVSALSATDWFTGSDLVFRATICFEGRFTIVQEGMWGQRAPAQRYSISSLWPM